MPFHFNVVPISVYSMISTFSAKNPITWIIYYHLKRDYLHVHSLLSTRQTSLGNIRHFGNLETWFSVEQTFHYKWDGGIRFALFSCIWMDFTANAVCGEFLQETEKLTKCNQEHFSTESALSENIFSANLVSLRRRVGHGNCEIR